MAHINLLPWREEQRQEQTRQFATVTVLSLILTGALMFLVHATFSGQIEHQKFRNKMLQDEINLSRRHDKIFSVLRLNIGNLEQIRTSHGRQAADELLQMVSASISGNIRVADRAAHLNNGEFALVLRETSVSIALNDTAGAGLGISVKGTTSHTKSGQKIDQGIFIRNVMHGGAAFKV